MQVGDLVKHKNCGGIGIITKGGIKQNLIRYLVMWMGADTPVCCWYLREHLEAI